MKKPSLIVVAVVVAALLAGGGYATGRFLTPRTYTAETVTKTVYEASDAPADLGPLQAENAALKTQLDNLKDELAKLQAAAEAPAPESAAEEPPRRMTRQERMEQLKRENPERYAEMERRRQEFQANMEAFQTRREDFFANLDLELLTPNSRRCTSSTPRPSPNNKPPSTVCASWPSPARKPPRRIAPPSATPSA